MTRSPLIVSILALVALLGASPAVAQDSAPAPSTITTTGYGEASAPAESADLQILISNEEGLYGGPPLAPQVEATPGAAAQAAVAPVADAISSSPGVESVTIVIPPFANPYSGPPSIARLDVTVASPDLAMLSALVTTASQAAAGERLVVSYVGIRYTASDCHELEQAARQAALDDARSRAGIQASLLGAELGEVIATRDVAASSIEFDIYGAVPAAKSNCDAAMVSGPSSVNSASLPRFDPTTDSGEVELYRAVEFTFAMTGNEATPAA